MSTENTQQQKSTVRSGSSAHDTGVSREELANRVKQLERRLEAVECIFSDRVIDKEQAHVEAQQKDAREQLATGETRQVVVEEPPAPNDDQAVTHVNGIVVFINNAPDLEQGETLKVRFTDVDSNYAHAVPL